MKTIEIQGKYNTILTVDPNETYFIATYKDKEIKSDNLLNTGWKDLPDGIVKLTYYLSNGVVIEIPNIFDAYLHLVEVSRSLFNEDIIYHYVYIKCKKLNDDKIISYRISLKEDTKNCVRIGDIYIEEEDTLDNPYWKKAEVTNNVSHIN